MNSTILFLLGMMFGACAFSAWGRYLGKRDWQTSVVVALAFLLLAVWFAVRG